MAINVQHLQINNQIDITDSILFVVVNFDAVAQAIDFRKETSCLPLLYAGFEPRDSGTGSPVDRMPADKPTELSRIELFKLDLNRPFLRSRFVSNSSLYRGVAQEFRKLSGAARNLYYTAIWHCPNPSNQWQRFCCWKQFSRWLNVLR